MGVIQVQLPDELRSLIERRIAEGRVASEAEFLAEAVRRFDADLAVEDEVVAEALIGIADTEGGRFVTIASPDDSAALHEQTMARLRERLAADQP